MLDKPACVTKLGSRRACTLQEPDAGEDFFAKGARHWRSCVRSLPREQAAAMKENSSFLVSLQCPLLARLNIMLAEKGKLFKGPRSIFSKRAKSTFGAGE